jgi:hypothetical protein
VDTRISDAGGSRKEDMEALKSAGGDFVDMISRGAVDEQEDEPGP